MIYDGYESEGAKVWLSVTELEELGGLINRIGRSGQLLSNEFRDIYELVLMEIGKEKAIR